MIPGTPDHPNGITITRDERALFITGTDGLVRYDLDATGAVASSPMTIGTVAGGLDGMGIDCAGNLYVAGGDRVTVLAPDLSILGSLDAAGATNVAFGGTERRTIFITSLGSDPGLRSAELNVVGYPF